MESRDEYLKIVIDYLYDGKVPETRKVECCFESELNWLGGLPGYFVTIYPLEFSGGVSSAHHIFCAIGAVFTNRNRAAESPIFDLGGTQNLRFPGCFSEHSRHGNDS